MEDVAEEDEFELKSRTRRSAGDAGGHTIGPGSGSNITTSGLMGASLLPPLQQQQLGERKRSGSHDGVRRLSIDGNPIDDIEDGTLPPSPPQCRSID
jgi:hypothetical protein